MKVCVLGASGQTGKLVVKELLNRNIHTRILIRETATISEDIKNHPLIEIVKGNVYDFDRNQMNDLVKDCDAGISCLGHNISFKGLFGKPRNLVVHAVKHLLESVKALNIQDFKFILMSTTAYTNKKVGEKNTLGEKLVLSSLSLLLPPHLDNMRAANYLLSQVNTTEPHIKWVAVRPDSLIDMDQFSPYEIKKSPDRSPVFNAGKTSRVNVGHFMVDLLTQDQLWKTWEYQTPVIYNK